MPDAYTEVNLSPLRKVIAERMSEAKRTIPHFRLVLDIEMDALLRLRAEANAQQPNDKVTINDCLIKACAIALMTHPELNCQFVENKVHRYHQADISVVVAVNGGISAPVLRKASEKSLLMIAAEMKALTQRASAGQLKMNEIVGGSFSISNLGGYGIDQFDAIINPPQCAILAVGRMKPRPIASIEGQSRIANLLTATLSVDHRVIDGATAAQFMATLREVVERPRRIFEY
jgi:pyruvate dehydrogenase E2 component (dihydrolipoamide acetyltransferase)